MRNFLLTKSITCKIKVILVLSILVASVVGLANEARAMCDPVGGPCSSLECGPDCRGDTCQYCYSTGTCATDDGGISTYCDIEYDCNAWEEPCKGPCPCEGPSDDGCDEKDPESPVCDCASCSPGMNSTVTDYVVDFSWQETSDWGEGCPNDNKYKVYLREAGSGDWSGTKVCEEGENTTSCSFNLCDRYGGDCQQALGKSYEWKVRADNGPRDSDSSTCSFRVADDTVAPTGDLNDPDKVCPYLDESVQTAFTEETYGNEVTLHAYNIIDHPGDDAWGTSLSFFYVVLADKTGDPEGGPDGVGDIVADDGWGKFDWKLNDEATWGTYFLNWNVVDPPEKGPISDTLVWNNTITFGGNPRHLNDLEPGNYQVGLHLRDAAGNINGGADSTTVTVECPGFVEGHVWQELVGGGRSFGIQDPDENISGNASIVLQNSAGSEFVLDPLGFDVAVEESAVSDEYRIKIEPDTCYCPCSGFNKHWNNSSDPSTGSGISYDEPLDDLFFANVGGISSMETKYAWMGIQKADFSVNLPAGPLTLDPGGEDTEVLITTRVVGDCWDPATARVSFNTSSSGVSGDAGVTLTGFSSDAAGCVSPSLSIDLDPASDTENTGWACLSINEDEVDYDETYTLNVTGTGTEACLGSHSDSVDFNVELLTWFQSEAGDVYSGSGISTYIPAGAEAFRDEPPSRFEPAPYFSLARSSAGLVMSSAGPHSWGEGDAYDSSKSGGWELKNYGSLGFYDASDSRYNFDYSYFDNAVSDKIVDCGSGASMEDGSVGGCLVADGSVLKVNGDLVIRNNNGFDGRSAAILVAGDVLFASDFVPDNGSYVFVSKGNIEVKADVENVKAVLLSDQGIYDHDPVTDTRSDFEEQENGLWVQGSAIAFGYYDEALILSRTRIGKDGDDDSPDDDLEPANYFSFDPESVVKLTPLLGENRITWRELN